MDLQLGGVEHLDAQDVVLPAVARPEGLGHGRDADAQQPAPLARLLLLAQEILVADRFEPEVEALAVLAGIGEEPPGRAMGEVVVAHQVDAAELGLVHAQVGGGRLHHALLEVHGLGDPE